MRNRGFGLIIIMVFLVVCTLISLGLFEKLLINNKMESFYEDKFRSFYLAEKCLLAGEDRVIKGIAVEENCAIVNLINEDSELGMDFYKIMAIGQYKDSVTILHSIVGKPKNDTSLISEEQSFLSGRISFLWYDG